jgi:RNA polymerase sigma-70 factor (ECF subfamily)
MSDQTAIPVLVGRIREGDASAAEELVRRFEPLIRREVRFRLEDPRLQRVFDSMDVCQSVLASFFIRAAAGEYDLDDPAQLRKLLVAMTRNKVATEARRHSTKKRDHRRETTGDAGSLAAIAGSDESPSEVVAGAELLERFHAGLSAEERGLADLRAEGLAWSAIAEKLGGTAAARRMQLSRAIERVAASLGLDVLTDE